MRLYLGIDGGGTKTEAVILSEVGSELGRGAGGPCNIATIGPETWSASIGAALDAARSHAGLPTGTVFDSACAGVAGCTARDRLSQSADMLARIVPARACRVEPDFVIAYWGATGGKPAIVVSAGTGAVTYGRNAAGQDCRVDGRGFLLGDRGSAFSIGRDALVLTLRRLDANEPPRAVGDRILGAMDVLTGDGLVEWVYRDFLPARIAALAEPVLELAGHGDEDALGIVVGAGESLAASVLACAARLRMDPAETAIYLAGGLWRGNAVLRAAFERRLPATARLCEPERDPAFGAALLAMAPT